MNKIPDDFNWEQYLKLNTDLTQTSNKKETIKHYLNYGIKENRIYSINKDKHWL